MKRVARVFFVVLVLAGCDNWVITYDASDPSPFLAGKISADGTDEYTFTGTNGAVDVRPFATNTGGNTREVFWPSDGPDETDEQTCAEWGAASGDFTQQGAALRIASAGPMSAITVTKNVAFGAKWIFNFHGWNASGGTIFAHFDLTSVFYPNQTLVPLPWQMCARTLRGRLEFKAWPSSEPEPAWGDTTHGGSAPIPAGWDAPGKAGWYIGHLPPDGYATFDHLVAWKDVLVSPTSVTTSG
jgi:hypothetical protein